jgi:hypothetical protein
MGCDLDHEDTHHHVKVKQSNPRGDDTTDYRKIEISALWKGFPPYMGGNPFQRAKIFFGCRFGDFVLIPT